MWHHPIGGEFTGYNPYPLCTGFGQMAVMAFIPNVDVLISYRRVSSHPSMNEKSYDPFSSMDTNFITILCQDGCIMLGYVLNRLVCRLRFRGINIAM